MVSYITQQIISQGISLALKVKVPCLIKVKGIVHTRVYQENRIVPCYYSTHAVTQWNS